MKILIINGPNLNMLGIRETGVYGQGTYDDLCEFLEQYAVNIKMKVDIRQSNSEGELIDYIQGAYEIYDGIIINPGAYTHYSYAIYDAILSVSLPTIEVHISNIHKREEFRHKSVIAPACIGQVCGLGWRSYALAMDFFADGQR